jgi:PAS domain S-box-containing protein
VYADSTTSTERISNAQSEAEYILESHSLLQSISDNAPAGIAMLDKQFRFVRVNGTLARMNGLPSEAHIGRTPRELFPQLPMDDLETSWRRVLETGEPVLGVEFCGQTPAAPGCTRWWREDWYPVRMVGEIVGVAAVVVEVTDQKRAEELQRLLVGIVGHDLRNPLSVIVTSARMLLLGDDANERQTKLTTRIERAARRIEVLARDLLDYTSVTRGGGIPVQPRDADLTQIVEAAADEVRVVHPDAVIERSGEGDVRGTWDQERIQQLAGNLLTNAAKYGTPGEPIVARWHATPGHAVLEVHNTGRPIPPERLPHIFDGLSQWPDEQSRQGGIGLGLFISREIVRAHGGVLEVASTEADGTTIRVHLPKQPPAS